MTSYIWCGSKICQARNASNSPIRGYYSEGEYLPGTSSQSYYYGLDQIGSVRRVFASTTSAPAYGYDPYGSALQNTAPLTDFNYAGMFYNADSGLYLTRYRAYDPMAGRWLSRDRLGEFTDPAANLYPYVGGNPLSATDPTGEVYSPTTFRFWGVIGRICGLLMGSPTAPVDPPPSPPPVESPANPTGPKGAPPPSPPEGPGGLRPPPPPPEPPIFRPPPTVP
jgi:RHS repeat-associated protein